MGRFMRADIKLENIYEIKPEMLRENGIKGLLFDIDNTLEEYATEQPKEKSIEFLRMLSENGFKIGILSNAKHLRAAYFLDGFPKENYPEIYLESQAGKPLKKGFRKLISKMGIKPEETVMVGDQLYTDIWGGNRTGCKTILVTPINKSIEPAFVRFKRLIEKPFM